MGCRSYDCIKIYSHIDNNNYFQGYRINIIFRDIADNMTFYAIILKNRLAAATYLNGRQVVGGNNLR